MCATDSTTSPCASRSTPTPRQRTSGPSSLSRRSVQQCSTSSRTRRTSPSKSPDLPLDAAADPMEATTVIVGAGHAGLAMSRRLTERAIDHVVLERGEVANSWRTERWPTLRLLTPNWQTVLPGYAYHGDDPDGFMAASDVADVVSEYASAVVAPVHTHTAVRSVRARAGGYEVRTDDGTWSAATVVLAS